MQRVPVQTSSILLFVAIAFQLLAAISNEGFDDFNQNLQILQFASLKDAAELPPELQHKTQPALQAALAAAVIQGAKEIGITSPFVQAALFRILSAALGVFASLLLFNTFKRECRSFAARNWLFSLLLLLWFLVFIRARFSSENWSGLLFFIGIAWYYQEDTKEDVRNILVGAILGLALFFRLEIIFMIAGFIAWLIIVEKEDWRVTATLLAGMAATTVINILADRSFYGEWTFTPWNYFAAQISGEISYSAQTQPWWFYFSEIARRGFYPLGILILLCGLYFVLFFRTHILTWVVVPFLVAHMLIPGKDLRALYPVALAVPVVVVLSFQKAHLWIRSEGLRERIEMISLWLIQPLWGLNLIIVATMSFLPADPYAPLYQRIYNDYGGQDVILVHGGDDPYGNTPRQMHFYAPQHLQRVSLTDGKQLQEIAQTNPHARLLFLHNDFSVPDSLARQNLSFTLVYRNLPEWRPVVQVFEWLGRGTILTLYEVRSNNRQRTTGLPHSVIHN